MLNRTNVVRMGVVIAVLVASSALAGTALARQDAPPKLQEKLALGQDQVQESARLIGSAKDGKVSKQEITNVKMRPQSSSHERTFASFGK